ncbi:ClbS/DfsB family four-helix bundle protein [Agromyces bauzanensis]
MNHLHAWHVLLVGWLDEDAAGRAPAYPAEGYDWVSLDALNVALRDRHRDVDLEAARDRLRSSHAAVLARVERLDDADLFDGSRHPWLGGGTLAEPVHECLGGHYEWALAAVGSARLPR